MSLWENLKRRCGFMLQLDMLEQEIDSLVLQNLELTKKYTDVMRFNMDCMHVLTLMLDEEDPEARKAYVSQLIDNQPAFDE